MKKKIMNASLMLAMVLFLMLCVIEEARAADQYEYAWFPAPVMDINQLPYEKWTGYGKNSDASHGSSNQNAIDMLPGGRLYAPFTGKVVYMDYCWGYVVFQSINKVHFADGTLDYMTVCFMHDSDISDLEYYYNNRNNENGIIAQGTPFYDAGGQGGVYDQNTGKLLYYSPYAYGSHVHLSVNRGQITREYSCGGGNMYAYEALYVNPDRTKSRPREGKMLGNNYLTDGGKTDWKGLWKDLPNGYLSKCQDSYPCHADLKVTTQAWIYAIPCNQDTAEKYGASEEQELKKLAKVGETYEAVRLYRNTEGNYWYEVIWYDEVTGVQQKGYLYSTRVKATLRWDDDDVKITNPSRPSRIRKGIDQFFAVQGIVESKYANVNYIWGYIKDSNGNIKYQGNTQIQPGYSLNNGVVDNSLLFGDLPVGNYTYELYVQAENYYADGNQLSESPPSQSIRKVVFCNFAVVDPTPVKYTVYFHGGTDTDYFATATVTSGNAIGTLPTVASEFGYTFSRWYTGAHTVTKDYIITGNTHVYAEFKAKNYCVYFNTGATTDTVCMQNIEYGSQFGTLPTPSRSGFVFNGWFTAREGGQQVKSDMYFRYNGQSALQSYSMMALAEERSATEVDLPFNGDSQSMELYAHWSVAEAHGVCGENLIWEIDQDGVLTISGTGAMYDYPTASDVPWDNSRAAITKIVLPDEVTRISDNAFCNVTNIRTVEIPYTVRWIGEGAFKNCSKLSAAYFYGDEPISTVSEVFDGCAESFTLYKRSDSTWRNSISCNTGEVVCAHEYKDSAVAPTCVNEGYERHLCRKCGVEYRDNIVEATGIHFYTYQAAENKITETCVNGCDHQENVTISTADSVYYYLGDPVTPASVRYSSDWKGGELIPVYEDNTAVGTATASISIDGASASVNFSLKAPEDLAEGIVGDNLTWRIREDGVLFVHCDGDMPDWSTMADTPWSNWENDQESTFRICEIVVDGDVTSIGNYAFESKAHVESVTLPDSITRIGSYAFYGCYALSEIDLPEQLEYIGASAFNGCHNLRTIDFPDSLSVIAAGAFDGCSSLKTIVLGANITIVSGASFGTQTALEEILVDDANPLFTSVDGVLYNYDRSALIRYPAAKENPVFYVPNTVERIGWQAFYGNSNLREIHIPYSVMDIQSYAFSGCYQLENAWFYGDTPFVGLDIFDYDADSLTLHYPEENETWPSADLAEYGQSPFVCGHSGVDREIPPTCVDTGYTGLVCQYCGAILETYRESPANGIHKLQYSGRYSTITESCVHCDHSATAVISEPDWYYVYTGEEITPAVVTYSDEWCGGELQVTYADNVEVGTATATIEIEGALAKVIFKIETEDSFPHGTCGDNLTWILSEGVLTIRGEGAMYDYDQEDAPWFSPGAGPWKVVIESGVTTIGNCAFNYCTRLEEVLIPDSVISIGDSAFGACAQLNRIDLPAAITSIGCAAFWGCSKLTEISVPEYVAHIGSDAFASCASLETIAVDENNPLYCSIDGVLFNKDRTALLSFPAGKNGGYSVPAGMTVISEYAFDNCTGLTWIDLPCSIEKIGEYAFSGCSALIEVRFRGAPPTVGKYAFENACTAFYPAGLTAWDDIVMREIGEDWTWEKENADISWSVDENGTLTISGTGSMEDYDWQVNQTATTPWYSYHDVITRVVVEDGIVDLGAYAFAGCANLRDVDLPESLLEIGKGAFFRCAGLSSIDLPANLPYIGDFLFAGCTGLKTVVIPERVAWIGEDAFGGCSSLSQIIIPPNVAYIGNYAFVECGGLSEIFFLGDAPEIAEYAVCAVTSAAYYPARNDTWTAAVMQDYDGELTWMAMDKVIASGSCGSMTSWMLDETGKLTISGFGGMDGYMVDMADGGFSVLEHPWEKYVDSVVTIVVKDGVTDIGPGAFYNCESAVSAYLSDTVTNIGERAFYGCMSLKNVSISATIEEIGDYALSKCYQLENVYYHVSEAKWKSVVIGTGNSNLDLDAIQYDSYGGVQASGISWKFDTTALTLQLSAKENAEILLERFDPDLWSSIAELTTVLQVGKGVSVLKAEWFQDFSNLREIQVEPSNPDFMSKEGILYNNECTTLLLCPPVKETVSVPASVTTIDAHAFAACGSLKTILFEGNAPGVSGETETLFPLSPNVEIRYYLDTAGWTETFWSEYALRSMIRFGILQVKDVAGGILVQADTSAWAGSQEDGVLLCAVYDEDHKMIGISLAQITGGEQELFIACDIDTVATGKLFCIEGQTQIRPLSDAVGFDH